jgi:hypothetical protein
MKTKLGIFVLISLLVVLFTGSAMAQCKSKESISAPGQTAQYTACNSELKTTFKYAVPDSGGTYTMISVEVENTPFSDVYIASTLCPNPPCADNVIEWNHCTTLTNHRIVMDGTTGMGGFSTNVLTAEYFADDPD